MPLYKSFKNKLQSVMQEC